MKIFNTLSRQKEEFKPIEEGKVRIYVCGPTVYNYIHIGNARPMMVFDTLRRYLEYRGLSVNYVSNFTDVDDKIIKAANAEGVDSSVISERFIAECKKDMESLNVRPATTHPKATEEIDGMIEMIQTLIDKGHAYVAADGTVYYRVHSFKGYGKLSHKNLDDLEAGHRFINVTGDDGKENEFDFVLWKPKKEGEPYWESPWCQGRPGWHIECSVMSKRYLGDTIDIHAGGEDLIFPHHENEIAQSEAANGVPFAKYWMHNAFLNIDNKKMAKSAGNFFTVRDISEKYDLEVLRFFMLSAHYRSPLNFSADLMAAARSSLDRIRTCAQKLNEFKEKNLPGALTEEEKGYLAELDAYKNRYNDAMDDDLNTADAISVVFELVRFINSKLNDSVSGELINEFYNVLSALTDVLGLKVFEVKDAGIDEELTAFVLAKIDERKAAKKAKDFAKADAIRDELLAKGIIIEDTREGVKWKKA